MRVKDRMHAAQRVPGDGSDFGFSAFVNREPRHSGTAQVLKRHPDYASCLARLAPRRSKAVRCPRFSVAVGEDDRAALRCGVERGFKRRTNGDFNAPAGLRLP
jgi:hypothetical protein